MARADRHGLPIGLVEGFLYPAHSALRMHAVADRTGAALMAALLQAASAAGVDILTSAKVTTLFVDESRRVSGVAYERPDGTTEEIGCAAMIPACSGFGGNPDMDFDDYRNAFAHGAVQQSKTPIELAA